MTTTTPAQQHTTPFAPATVETIRASFDADAFAAMESPAIDEFATFATPLVRNCWYVAARADEVTRTPFSRKLLGTDVLFYRTRAGEIVGMRNRCPHRSFPLAKGTVDGDDIVCGYHGMEFGPDGLCTKMPALANAPTTVSVRTYPVMEQGPLVWIWMGSPDLADTDLVPDTTWLTDPGWTSVTGDFHINGDYVSMHENLIDQTHFPFLHPGAVGTPEYARSKLTAATEGDKVVIRRELRNSAPPGIYGVPLEIMDKKVDRTSEAWFVSPAMHVAFAGIHDPAPADGRPEDYRWVITHVFTPETNTSIHYWWFNSRDHDRDQAQYDDFMYTSSSKAYAEDVEALEWIMDVVRNDAEPQIDLSFAPDKPGLLARRAMYRLASREN